MKIRVEPFNETHETWDFSLEERYVTKADGVQSIEVIATNGTAIFYLLRIYPDGTFSRWPDVESPFKVDKQGRLIEVPFKG